MAFDKSTRNSLQRFVSDARSLLTDEFTRQLQQDYGLDPKIGEVADLSKLSHLDDSRLEIARVLREILAHYLASELAISGKKSQQNVLERIVREQAFTVLNRLAALRMMEARGLLLESVANGYQSKGFQLYERLAGHALGETGDVYRCYLFSLFDEFALDLKVLFDRNATQGLLFAREPTLLALLELLNTADMEPLWAEDETIGWIYQYWNSKEERKAMRDASAAPRNSRELAVRNQFFTPRYVVEFLTDNTLGRIWYEMTKGETRLKDQCRYLVRRPTEIFLGEGEAAPETSEQEGPSQEELLNQPVHIPHRPAKDPREIRLLDPACGSMHFGLYAFDLFEAIYEEAWGKGLCPALQEAYPGKDDYLRDVPRLIIEHNIHGVDIDPRAVQIAGLSLWLRAQKTWKDTPAAERPRVRRSNIVCAEPMPGSDAMLEDFVQTLDPPLLGEFVKTVFDKMQLAGEAGTLLKIEEEIRTAIDDARQAWETLQRQSPELFSTEELNRVTDQPELSNLDTALRAPGSQLTSDFFDTAEERIYAALRDYAESAEAGDYQRRLFAEDAAHGFAFIDLCRKLYEVVIMNPPFGEEPIGARSYISSRYQNSKSDVGMAFIECLAAKLSAGGRLGAITNRVFIANDTLEAWRDAYLYGERTILSSLVDLGYGVLDDAKVEAACYVVHDSASKDHRAAIVRVLDDSDKEAATSAVLGDLKSAKKGSVFFPDLSHFDALPGRVLAYQLPTPLIARISEGENLTSLGGKAAVGLQPSDDFRFVRLVWEVAPTKIGRKSTWVHYAKGGEYQPYWDDIHLLVNWRDEGAEIRNFYGPNGKIRSRPQNIRFYFRKGVTWPERTTSDFSPRVLPENCIFSVTGQGIFCGTEALDLAYIAGAYGRAFKLVIDGIYGSGDASSPASMATHYRSGVLSKIPPPIWVEAESIHGIAKELVRDGMELFATDETSRFFCIENPSANSLQELMAQDVTSTSERVARIAVNYAVVDSKVFGSLGFDSDAIKTVESLMGPNPGQYESREPSSEEVARVAELWQLTESDLIRTITSQQPARRQLTMKSYIANRRYELIAHALRLDVKEIARVVSRDQLLEPNAGVDCVDANVQMALGCSFGRWDIRYATGELQPPELPDPFDPLPVCPPGMLQNADALPAAPADVPDGYPLRITWPGILVDDDGHPEDIVARVRDALAVIWGDRAPAIEQEACEILGVRTLRDYFAENKSGGKFFKNHLKRYSKSRRKAPIYWPLSTKSGSYTLWIYYHRINDQILYVCVNDFVEPKLRQVSDNFESLRKKSDRTGKQEKELTMYSDLKTEFEEYRDELLRIAKFWKPNLNDGVQITAAPLWPLFRHKPWQKVLKDTWKKLEKGDYDWAHLAMNYWPDRVREKCRADKSLAIAHEIEDIYEEPSGQPTKKRAHKKA